MSETPTPPQGGADGAPTTTGGAPPKRSRRPRKKSRTGPWRAAVLVTVHVLFVIHLTHWLVAGKTLSPVEPSESMFTLEQGKVNAGFVFFGIAILSTIVFGRFFCGWGCHIVALQDFCGWLMKKAGVRPKPFRSRVLAWGPLLLALYMFVWPNFKRWVLFPLCEEIWPAALALFKPVYPWDGFHNDLVTEDFWATFAPWMWAIPFLFICGFAVVYLLGSKAFCTYGCPYGGVFAGMDRLAAGQILADLDTCERCGHCTANCTSNVRIHEEIQLHERVVSPGCMKCMDCVSVCPTGALSYGFARPALLGGRKKARRPRRRHYDFSAGEEIAFAGLGFVVFLAYRGLYGRVPMLMAVGIALCIVFLTWKGYRLFRDRNVAVHRFRLKHARRITPLGWAFLTALFALTAFTAHSAVVRYHVLAGNWHYDLAVDAPRQSESQERHGRLGLHHYSRADAWRWGGWGLWETSQLNLSAVRLAQTIGDLDIAAARLEREVEKHRGRAGVESVALPLVSTYVADARPEKATELLESLISETPENDALRENLAFLHLRLSQPRQAESVYRKWIAHAPDNPKPRVELSTNVLLPSGRGLEALAEIDAALESEPEMAALHEVRARILWSLGDPDQALQSLERAVELEPEDDARRQRLEMLREERARRP